MDSTHSSQRLSDINAKSAYVRRGVCNLLDVCNARFLERWYRSVKAYHSALCSGKPCGVTMISGYTSANLQANRRALLTDRPPSRATINPALNVSPAPSVSTTLLRFEKVLIQQTARGYLAGGKASVWYDVPVDLSCESAPFSPQAHTITALRCYPP